MRTATKAWEKYTERQRQLKRKGEGHSKRVQKAAKRAQARLKAADGRAHPRPPNAQSSSQEEKEEQAGYFWNEDKFCSPCLKVLEGADDFHLDLIPADQEADYDPTLKPGQRVGFKIDDQAYGGVMQRRQTFYQVCR